MLEGGAGKDQLDGGKGVNTASYEHATSGVTASLDKPNTNTGDAAGDTYKGIQNLLGSAFNDKLTGDGKANVLTGGAGIDTLSGGGGDDKLIGGPGADILNGGAGKDQFVQLSPLEGIDRIQDFNVKDDTLVFSAAGFGGGLNAGQQLVAGQTFIASTIPLPPRPPERSSTTPTTTICTGTPMANRRRRRPGAGRPFRYRRRPKGRRLQLRGLMGQKRMLALNSAFVKRNHQRRHLRSTMALTDVDKVP